MVGEGLSNPSEPVEHYCVNNTASTTTSASNRLASFRKKVGQVLGSKGLVTFLAARKGLHNAVQYSGVSRGNPTRSNELVQSAGLELCGPPGNRV
jgi:ABC-type lipoprotein export system ATPase subunit